MSRDIEIAWAAGFFEGEGCISLERARRNQSFRQLQIAVTSTDHDVLARFTEVVGFGAIYKQKSNGSKQAWRAIARGDKAVKALRLFLPYLGHRRYAKALEAISEREKQIEASTATRVCRSCGTYFRPTWGRNASRQLHCSAGCRTAHRRIK